MLYVLHGFDQEFTHVVQMYGTDPVPSHSSQLLELRDLGQLFLFMHFVLGPFLGANLVADALEGHHMLFVSGCLLEVVFVLCRQVLSPLLTVLVVALDHGAVPFNKRHIATPRSLR